MSSEIHKYIENAIDKKSKLFKAKVLDFPISTEVDFPISTEVKVSKNVDLDIKEHWKINDKSNIDQLRAVVGICIMFFSLILMGLYSNLI